jgi:hypothetical protein
MFYRVEEARETGGMNAVLFELAKAIGDHELRIEGEPVQRAGKTESYLGSRRAR